MKLYALVCLALLMMALNACSAKVEGTSPSLATTPNSQNQNTGAATVLEGTWKSACLVFSSQYSMTTAFTFTGNQVIASVVSFADGACTAQVSNQAQAGTFVIGAASADVPNATQIDINIQGQTKYDIFAIQGQALYFGNNPGTTAATRSTTLNLQGPLQKN